MFSGMPIGLDEASERVAKKSRFIGEKVPATVFDSEGKTEVDKIFV